MRAVWVDEGNDPNWDKLSRHGITWVFLSLQDPIAATRSRLLEIKARGLVAGVYGAWNWYPGTSGLGFAEAVHARLSIICPDATALWPRVQLNDETHDPARIAAMLRRWRQLRPTTGTSWTLEGHQGGWFTPDLVKAIIETKTRVVPQCYTGPMIPTDTLAEVRDITRRGIPDSMVSPFHDAAALRPWWDGFAFTQGRLPS